MNRLARTPYRLGEVGPIGTDRRRAGWTAFVGTAVSATLRVVGPRSDASALGSRSHSLQASWLFAKQKHQGAACPSLFVGASLPL